MSELAFDCEGQAIESPDEAVAGQVQRAARGSQPWDVYTTEAPVDELTGLARTSRALAEQILARPPLLRNRGQVLLRVVADAVTTIRGLIK